MKMLITLFSAAIISFSANTLASSERETLKALQDACKLKQVPRLCAVNLPNKNFIGQCVDAKAYGLICVYFRQS
ncbi:hypothetical protein ACOMICROBIO_GDFFDHBD_03970 [Vibrio sp. B1REV9]|uniref:hypothetical protein n=1 Tax=Vibrio sp. B1REV9 TaxID=2751179 RepID=UPI001B1F15BC|nr:hypothetical protein [Vibrio sp. B1REV9]CAE6955771.1 hypothetical protein ACOMICROBIO_GDFFDHBD_03970 [Vibrio sp. B1REV9]